MRLSQSTLASLSSQVSQPGYHRDEQAVGIVHFGIGAFHRAHQAWYTDRAMEGGNRDWGVLGVSLRSPSVADQLNPQDGLYTVTEKSADGDATRLIGAVKGVLVASQQGGAVVEALSAPATRIVSFTVTEKGYCRSADGSLDPDLAGPSSFYAYLSAALRRRKDAGLPGLTLLSCDNLADNGRQLEGLMAAYLDRHDPALRGWFEAECACPSTMVDRIVPATTQSDLDDLNARIGVDDRGAVMTEPFTQWVIEDRFAGERPRWEAVGAQLVGNVASYETAKLRMLNGAHSMLAYCGLRRGYQNVHEAVGDTDLRRMAHSLMLNEAAPTIAAGPDQDLTRYADELFARFANPALNHRLIQIAMDGSQKIPQRWLETLAANQGMGRDCPAILGAVACWIEHLRGANGPVDDPRAEELRAALDGSSDPVQALFAQGGKLASEWLPGEAERTAILGALSHA